MFTIKVLTPEGHFVTECNKYAFIRGNVVDGVGLTVDRLECGDDPGGADAFITLGKNTVFVMNSNGKTVDSFQIYPPDHPVRLAADPSVRPPNYDEQFAKALAVSDGRAGAEPVPDQPPAITASNAAAHKITLERGVQSA